MVKNEILEDHGEWLLVDISTPKHPGATMAVDRDMFEAHEGGRIYAFFCKHSSYIYARYSLMIDGKRRNRFLHHDVIEVAEDFVVDHIQHGTTNFINNRLSNLRSVTQSQNCMNAKLSKANSSGIKGVSWHLGRQRWQSHIMVHGKLRGLGEFDNIDFAIGARQQAEREYYGEYAHGAKLSS